MNPISPEEFAEKMRSISECHDIEVDHREADQLLCGMLKALGYGEGVDVFLKTVRWYS